MERPAQSEPEVNSLLVASALLRQMWEDAERLLKYSGLAVC